MGRMVGVLFQYRPKRQTLIGPTWITNDKYRKSDVTAAMQAF